MEWLDWAGRETLRLHAILTASMRFPPVGQSPPNSDGQRFASIAPWFFTYEYFAGFRAPFPLVFMVGMALLYLVVVYVAAPLCRPPPAVVARVRQAHNVALCVFSGVCFVGSTYHMIDSGELFDVRKMLCATEVPGWVANLNLAFLASKVWEWLDTVLLVWSADRSRPFSKLNFLHVYHHATTLWLFAIVANFPACTKMGMVLNGGVHTFMYLHYARPLPKRFVPLLTAAQIGQLAFTVFMWIRTPGECGGAFADFAWRDHFWVYATPYSFVPVYLAFFLRFFVRRFVLKTSHHARAARKSEKIQ